MNFSPNKRNKKALEIPNASVSSGKRFQDLEKCLNGYLEYNREIRSKKALEKRNETQRIRAKKNVEEEITHDFIEKVKKMFHDADLDGGGLLDMNEFIIAMRKLYPSYTDKELMVLYMKIDTNCDNSVDIIEYLMYILFEHQEKEHMFEMTRPKPYPKPPCEITFKCLQWDTIISVDFYPMLNRNGICLENVDYLFGQYFCLTRQGTLLRISIDFKLLRKSNLNLANEEKKLTTSSWATGMICIPDMNYIAISDIENNLTFYDLNTVKLDKVIVIAGLPNVVMCMHYRFSPKDTNEALLLCGDAAGNVIVFQPREKNRSMFHQNGTTSTNRTNTRVFHFCKLLDTKSEYAVSAIVLRSCHLGSVIAVRWILSLNLIMSCAATCKNSLFFGDIHGRVKQYYSSENGFFCFEYYKKMNMIITGGQDTLIRTWEPFVHSRPSNILRGHNHCVKNLIIDKHDETLLSIDKSLCVLIWYFASSKLLQKITLDNVNIKAKGTSACFYFNEKMQKLIFFTNKITAFEHANEIFLNRDHSSHAQSILCIIYNHLFDVLISADANSVINIWDMKTGCKIMHILDAHSASKEITYEIGAEITALAFDESLRKLISGAHDGTVAVWNFNNGVSINKFNADPDNDNKQKEITGIIHKNERLCVSSWNKTVFVYYLSSDGAQFLFKYPRFHSDIILSMDVNKNQLATSSYDGHIIFWGIEMGLPTSEFRLEDSLKLEFVDRSLETILKKSELRRINCRIKLNEVDTSATRGEEKHSTNFLLESNNYYVDKLQFLKTRTNKKASVNLFSASALGWIKAWSTDVNDGCLLAHFNSAHIPYDSVLTFTFNENEMLLFTADTSGYVKIWFIGDYFNGVASEEVKASKLKYESMFEFAGSDVTKATVKRIEAERRKERNSLIFAKNDQLKQDLKNLISYPLLLRYFRAHVKSITGIEYVDDKELIVTSSVDFNVRLFTLTGRYVGFFGQDSQWDLTADISLLRSSMPRDLRKVASSNTFKLVHGSVGPKWKLIQKTIRGLFSMSKL